MHARPCERLSRSGTAIVCCSPIAPSTPSLAQQERAVTSVVSGHGPTRDDSGKRHYLSPTVAPSAHRATTSTLATPQSPSPPLHTQRERRNTGDIRARSSSIRISQARGEEEEDTQPAGFVGLKMLPQMVAGKGGYSWKAAKARIPPYRQITHTVRSPRVLVPLAIVTAIVLLWRSMGSAASEVQRYEQFL